MEDKYRLKIVLIKQKGIYLLQSTQMKKFKKDPFFHNANSCIKKKYWKKIKFDNFVTILNPAEFGQIKYCKKVLK